MIKEVYDNETKKDSMTNKISIDGTDGSPTVHSEDGGLILNEALKQYTLPSKDELPQSVIVYNKEESSKEKALRLIEKYVYSINDDCIFEVNISSRCRQKIIRKSQQLQSEDVDFTSQQLYDLFDKMILELLRLLNDSHLRFVNTEDYKQLVLHDAV